MLRCNADQTDIEKTAIRSTLSRAGFPVRVQRMAGLLVGGFSDGIVLPYLCIHDRLEQDSSKSARPSHANLAVIRDSSPQSSCPVPPRSSES
jgi:hypothetical protein